ncbi:DUF4178 domain-containing protein [Hymenobacter sp. HMF4947]|uniref:DUF4178 domain-containing protein n=1 Tax=Hymenobacter ginkgonis TaxID=2682976 RepID=A0A7K1TJ13_9BACT|nr:DUF4178 domain-containing protein [Hymenobacter ginkgonis]MVN78171.1 DUF4178 domain-containing protein [Hymenobacter ginkgonis]
MSEALPPAASTSWVVCPQCAAQLPCHDPARSRYFGCFECRSFFRTIPAATTTAHRLYGFKKALLPGPSLPLGATGVLGGYHCRVTGYQVRGEKQDRVAEWREYQLRPAAPLPSPEPADLPLQLAEYQGHWLLIRRAPRFPGIRSGKPYREKSWRDPTTGRHYQLWHRYQPLVRDALGEFDWNILEDEKLTIQEFTAPPYLLSSEHKPDERSTWYLAEYLEPAEVAAAFGVAPRELPDRVGVGAAQPAPVPGWPQLQRLALVTLVLLSLAQAVLLGLHQPEQLPQEDFSVAEAGPAATTQMLTSKPFTLSRATALHVTLTAPSLTNHWVEVTASLVNEQTGRGYEFTRSLEFYQGVEDGYAWTEGDRSADALLAAVPAGRYHFNLYPSLDSGAGPTELRLDTEINSPLWSNYFVVLGALALVPLLGGWRRRGFEQDRWANSDFSPF